MSSFHKQVARLVFLMGFAVAGGSGCSSIPTAHPSREPANQDRAASAYQRRLSNPVTGCTPIDEEATSADRCCSYFRVDGSCETKEYYPNCGRPWSACTLASECCSGSCISNHCSPSASACAYVTESCLTDEQCCSGHCTPVVGGKICLGGANECALVQQRCGSDSECCSGDCLVLNGVGHCRPTSRDPARRGESCSSDSDCYTGLICGPGKTCR